MRAKSHDQRKGQWLINKIRSGNKHKKNYIEACKHGTEKQMIEWWLWNMENDEFDEYMDDYNE